MLHTILPLLHPSLAAHALRAAVPLPTGVAAFVGYGALALAGWVTWEGLRSGGTSDGPSDDESPPPPDVEIRKAREKKGRKKKRRGDINWIQ